MSTIDPGVDGINTIRISPIPTHAIKVVRAVRYNDTTVLVDENGKLYSNSLEKNYAYIGARVCRGSRMADMFTALWRLGVVPEAAAKHFLERQKADTETRNAGYSAQDLVKQAKELGIKLTAAQARRVNAAIKAKKALDAEE